MRVTNNENDEWIILSSEEHVHLLEEEEEEEEEGEEQHFRQSASYIEDLDDPLLFTNIQTVDQDNQSSVDIEKGFDCLDDVGQVTDLQHRKNLDLSERIHRRESHLFSQAIV